MDRQKERHKKHNENGEIEMSLNRNMPGRSQSRIPCLLSTRYFVPGRFDAPGLCKPVIQRPLVGEIAWAPLSAYVLEALAALKGVIAKVSRAATSILCRFFFSQ